MRLKAIIYLLDLPALCPEKIKNRDDILRKTKYKACNLFNQIILGLFAQNSVLELI